MESRLRGPGQGCEKKVWRIRKPSYAGLELAKLTTSKAEFENLLSAMAEAMNLELKIASCDKQRRNFYYQLTEKEKACDDWAKK